MTITSQFAQITTIMAAKFKFKLNPQVQLLFNLYIHVIDIWWLTNCRDFWWCKKNLISLVCSGPWEKEKLNFDFFDPSSFSTIYYLPVLILLNVLINVPEIPFCWAVQARYKQKYANLDPERKPSENVNTLQEAFPIMKRSLFGTDQILLKVT